MEKASQKRALLLRYGVAVLAGIAVVAVKLLLDRHVGTDAPFVLLFTAILISAWYGGLGPGLLATVVTGLAGAYLFLPPYHSLNIGGVGWLRVGIYMAEGAAISLLSVARERARAEAEARRQREQQEIAERTQAEEALRKRSEEITLLYEAGQLLGKTLDLDQVYDSMHRLVAEIMDCDSLLVSSFNPDDRMIRCVYAWVEGNRLEPATFPPVPLAPEGKGMQSTVIRTREPLRVPDVDERVKSNVTTYHVDADGTVRDKPVEDQPRTRSLLMVPILLEGRVLGIVQVMSHRLDAYTEEHLRQLEALTLQMAAAGRNAYLYEQAQKEIAERARAQAEIESLNTRLRQAMTETHHRVKNNLQVISALIEMQAMDHGDTVPASELMRLGMHIRTLAALHDLMTQQAREDAEARSISARTVLGKVAGMLQEVARPRAVHLKAQDARLVVRQATALALVLNELVSNALKHGQGDVDATFTVEEDTATLAVSDQGPGFPAVFDAQSAAQAGLELLDTAVRWDLSGAIEYGNRAEGGAQVVVTFPLQVQEPELHTG